MEFVAGWFRCHRAYWNRNIWLGCCSLYRSRNISLGWYYVYQSWNICFGCHFIYGSQNICFGCHSVYRSRNICFGHLLWHFKAWDGKQDNEMCAPHSIKTCLGLCIHCTLLRWSCHLMHCGHICHYSSLFCTYRMPLLLLESVICLLKSYYLHVYILCAKLLVIHCLKSSPRWNFCNFLMCNNISHTVYGHIRNVCLTKFHIPIHSHTILNNVIVCSCFLIPCNVNRVNE